MQSVINIRISSIVNDEFATFEEEIIEKIPIGFSTELEFNLLESKKRVNCIYAIKLVQKKTLLAKLKTTVGFEIKKEDYESFVKDSQLTIPKDLLKFIADVTIGMVRGILYTKLENTEFKRFVVPLVDLNEVINEDEVFELERK